MRIKIDLKCGGVGVNMDILVVYSEYSQKCKVFMDRLQSDPVIDCDKINKLCIDCPAIRQAVLEQTNLVIRRVPAVIVRATPTSMADVHEGKDATRWLQTFSDQLYDQLRAQQEEAEASAMQQQAEIDERVKMEAEALVEKKLKAFRLEQRQNGAAANNAAATTTIKQQARQIEQDRREKIVFDDHPPDDAAPQHVTQIKSDTSASTRVSDIVKTMEREREAEMANIRKTMPPPN